MLPESAKKSCMISHSAITRTAHTFSKYNSKPLLLESSCCSLNLLKKKKKNALFNVYNYFFFLTYVNGHFPGSLGKLYPINSLLRLACRLENSLYRFEHKCRPAIYILNT